MGRHTFTFKESTIRGEKEWTAVMGFWVKFSAKFILVSTFLLVFFSPKMVKTQMAGCSFQGLGLEQCISLGKNSISIDQSCCSVLNQVVEVGFHCLCLLLASHNPPLSTPILFPLSSNCFISTPPLTQCQALAPLLQPPVTPALQPPVPPALPVLLPPDIPQEPPQPSAPNAFLLPPPPPPPQEIPLKSTPDLSVFKSGYLFISVGHKKIISFQSRLFVAATLCGFMI